MPFTAVWMDQDIIILIEVSQSEKDKYNVTYQWDLKNTNELIYNAEINLQTQKANLWLPKGDGTGRE